MITNFTEMFLKSITYCPSPPVRPVLIQQCHLAVSGHITPALGERRSERRNSSDFGLFSWTALLHI